MAVPLANLKELITEFFEKGCDFSKVSQHLKKPMIVKVFRAEPMFLINDKENYICGFFTNKAVSNFERDFGFGLDNMKSKTLKITKFYLSLCNASDTDYTTVSYLGKQVKFVIEECTLGRYLKRGVDVNKFVVNIFRDRDVKLSLATYLHRKSLVKGSQTSLESFLSKKLKFSKQEVSELLSKSGPTYTDDRFKIREVVTCIVDGAYSSDTPVKKRSLKKEIKEIEEEEEEQSIQEESKNSPSSQSSNPETQNKSKKTYKGKKPRVKKILRNIENEAKSEEAKSEIEQEIKPEIEEEVEVPLSKIKMMPKLKEEISNILSRTDFINTKETKPIKMPSPVNMKQRRKNLNEFKEYLRWYDEKCVKSINATESRGSTNLSTPQKSCFKKIQRNDIEEVQN